jgi:hypothetical protein
MVLDGAAFAFEGSEGAGSSFFISGGGATGLLFSDVVGLVASASVSADPSSLVTLIFFLNPPVK